MLAQARTVLKEQNVNIEDRIFSIRCFGDGWIVMADLVPGWDGNDNPPVVVDGSKFIEFDAAGNATELSGYHWRVDLTGQSPADAEAAP